MIIRKITPAAIFHMPVLMLTLSILGMHWVIRPMAEAGPVPIWMWVLVAASLAHVFCLSYLGFEFLMKKGWEEQDTWLIWSNKEQSWWTEDDGEPKCTDDIRRAHHYSREAALRACAWYCGGWTDPRRAPDVIPVRAVDADAALQMGINIVINTRDLKS